MTPTIIAGLLARRGVYELAEKVIRRVSSDPHVKGVWVVTPQGKYRDAELLNGKKIAHIDRWEGENPNAKIGFNREILRKAIYSSLHDYFAHPDVMSQIEWIWMGDVDALPAEDYFEVLSGLKYSQPVVLTGKTYNPDGSRCWNNQWYPKISVSKRQHVMNRKAFDLNIGYLDTPLETEKYCRMLRTHGAQTIFRPELSMTLQKI